MDLEHGQYPDEQNGGGVEEPRNLGSQAGRHGSPNAVEHESAQGEKGPADGGVEGELKVRAQPAPEQEIHPRHEQPRDEQRAKHNAGAGGDPSRRNRGDHQRGAGCVEQQDHECPDQRAGPHEEIEEAPGRELCPAVMERPGEVPGDEAVDLPRVEIRGTHGQRRERHPEARHVLDVKADHGQAERHGEHHREKAGPGNSLPRERCLDAEPGNGQRSEAAEEQETLANEERREILDRLVD